MSLEVEAKFRVTAHEPIRGRLEALGAALQGRVLETNRILDRADGSLRRQGCGLRIRTARGDDGSSVHTLTFKGPRRPGALKTREELEANVGDAGGLAQLFERLGFAEVLRYEKRRETWRLGACLIELDEPAALGLFVEIEGPDESAVRAGQEKLGLADAALVPESYVSMLVRHCEEQGIADRRLSVANGPAAGR